MLNNYRGASQSKAVQTGMQKAGLIGLTPEQKKVWNEIVKKREEKKKKDKEKTEKIIQNLRDEKAIEDKINDILDKVKPDRKKPKRKVSKDAKAFAIWLRKKWEDNQTVAIADGEVYRTKHSNDKRSALDLNKTGEGPLYLYSDAVSGLDLPVHPMVEKLLRQGNLEGALRVIQATAPTKRVKQIAKALLQTIGTTKIRFVSDHKDPATNKSAAGSFDPKTNTIRLNPETGINFHTILHEATHAATSEVLSNKSHPVTKQLTEIFNDVKDSLSTFDGSQNVDEFVAEALGNVLFQQQLAKINVKGQPYTIWQRVQNTIGNMLRRLLRMEPKKIESKLNEVDSLIMSILSPAPEYRNAGELFSLSQTGKDIKDVVDSTLKNVPVYTSEIGNRIVDRLSDNLVPNTAKEFTLGLIPLNALADMSRKSIPLVTDLERLLYKQAGSIATKKQALEPAIKKISTWGQNNPDKQEDFNNVVYESTLIQVDPSENISKYAGNKEKLAAYKKMHQGAWKRIGEDGRNHYKTMRNIYKSQYDEIKRVLEERLEGTMGSEQTKKTVYDEIYKKLFESGAIEPYFPLTRSGKYWLSYNAIDSRTGNKEVFIEAYESKTARNKAKREIEADSTLKATEVTPFLNLETFNYHDAPKASFVNEILQLLEAGDVPKELQEQVMRLYLNALPERSFAQSIRSRKEGGVLGFKRDAIGALQTKSAQINRQLAQIEYGYKIQKFRDDMRKWVTKNAKDNETTVLLANEIDKRAKWGMNPDVQNWAKVATGAGFMWTLGFNVSSAVVNTSQLPMVVFPYFGAKYGYTKTMKAMGNATRLFFGSGLNRKQDSIGPNGEVVENVGAAWSLDNYDFDAADTPAEIKKYKELAEVASDFGMLNRSITYDMLDVHDDSKSKWQKLNMFSGFIFHHAERMNRQTTLATAYDLELDSMRSKGITINKEARIKAAEQAIYVTDLTNSGALATGAPRWGQRGVGKVAFLFKRYGISMYYLLARLTHDTFKGEERVVAAKQLAGMFGMSALIAGIHGIPFFGEIASIHDMLFEDEDEDDFETSVRKYIGEEFYGGIGNAVFRIDTASRMGLSNLVFREPFIKKDQSVFNDMFEMFAGPVYSTMLNMERGAGLLQEGEVHRGIEAMLPAAFRNGLKSYRFATEGANTLGGNPIVDNIGPYHWGAQAMGFAPAEYTRNLQQNKQLQKMQKFQKESKIKLYTNYYRALKENDTNAISKILKKIGDYNRRYPNLAITAEGIRRSLKQRAVQESRMHNGLVINPRMRHELMENADEWDDTLTFGIWD
jgi:hypothetical protein